MPVIAIGIYLGIGAILHAVFVGAVFDWSSAWTYGWLLGWPVAVGAFFFAATLVLGLAYFLFYLITGTAERIRIRRRREATRKDRA